MDEKALSTLTPEQAQVIPAIVQHMMGPLVEAMGSCWKTTPLPCNSFRRHNRCRMTGWKPWNGKSA